MRGISEETLKQLRLTYEADSDIGCFVDELIVSECEELSPWLPIDENTPKDRRLNLHWPGTGWITGRWIQLNNTVGYFTHDLSRYDPPSVKPTHYQELPDDPKE